MRQEEPLKLWEAGWGCFLNHFHFRTVGLRECLGTHSPPHLGCGSVPEALNAVSSTAWGQRRSVRGWPPSPSAPLALGALGYLGNDFSTPGGLGIRVLPAAPSTLQSGI